MMVPVIPALAAVFISATYCLWKKYQEGQAEKKAVLCQRVARLLWAVAHHDEQKAA